MKEGNMKKAFFLVLLVPILTIGLISCDASIRSNIADFMGGFSGNVYVEAGLVEPNKADAEAAVATVATMGTAGSTETAIKDSNQTVFNVPGVDLSTLSSTTTILAPQDEAEQVALKDSIASALASPTQTATLVEALSQPATTEQKAAAVGTVTVFNVVIAELQNALPADSELATTIAELALPTISSSDELTQGDILVLQLMTNLVNNTVASLNEITSNNLNSLDESTLDDAANKTKVLAIVDDALFTAQMAEQLSGAANIDFSGQLDLASLLDSLNKSSRSSISRAGTTIDLGDAAEYLATINGIVPDILDLMGVTKSGQTFSYTDPNYESFLFNQSVYRASMEHGMTFKKKGVIDIADLVNGKVDASTLIKYGLAVFFTEHDAYVNAKNTSDTGNSLILAFLNANTDFANGTLTETSQLVIPASVGTYYDDWQKFLYYGHITAISPKKRDVPYYKSILNTLIEVNDIGGISELTTELEEFRDNADTTDEGGLAGWYAGLIL